MAAATIMAMSMTTTMTKVTTETMPTATKYELCETCACYDGISQMWCAPFELDIFYEEIFTYKTRHFP